jgi:hypothetical protein
MNNVCSGAICYLLGSQLVVPHFTSCPQLKIYLSHVATLAYIVGGGGGGVRKLTQHICSGCGGHTLLSEEGFNKLFILFILVYVYLRREE